MEQEITPEQKEHLETWAGKRDSLISEISNLQNQKDKLEERNKELVNSYSDIELRAHETIGRLAELQKKEAELPALISKEIASLEARKSVLETEITNFSKMIDILSTQKTSLEKDVTLALSNFNTIKGESLLLEKIVDHVTQVSEKNKFVIEDLVESIKKSSQEVIDINQKNVSETNMVLQKLPAMLVELQKNKLIKARI